jgi:hypothetical protein
LHTPAVRKITSHDLFQPIGDELVDALSRLRLLGDTTMQLGREAQR